MFDDQTAARALLGPADPARDTAVAPPANTAHEIIAIADRRVHQPIRRPRPVRPLPGGRRLALGALAAAVLAARLGVDQIAQRGAGTVFGAVRDVYATQLVPRQTRAAILRILADIDGVSWRGTTKDRAGRDGVAISVAGAGAEQLLIFDAGTGALLAWDEVQRPVDTVAGATLILDRGRTDTLG